MIHKKVAKNRVIAAITALLMGPMLFAGPCASKESKKPVSSALPADKAPRNQAWADSVPTHTPHRPLSVSEQRSPALPVERRIVSGSSAAPSEEVRQIRRITSLKTEDTESRPGFVRVIEKRVTFYTSGEKEIISRATEHDIEYYSHRCVQASRLRRSDQMRHSSRLAASQRAPSAYDVPYYLHIPPIHSAGVVAGSERSLIEATPGLVPLVEHEHRPSLAMIRPEKGIPLKNEKGYVQESAKHEVSKNSVSYTPEISTQLSELRINVTPSSPRESRESKGIAQK